jgi:hypothetical protein
LATGSNQANSSDENGMLILITATNFYRLDTDSCQQYELFDTRFVNGCSTPWTPNDHCVPVNIQETSKDCWTLTAPPALPSHPEHPIIATTFDEYLRYLPENEQHLFASVDLLLDPYAILDLFNTKYHDPMESDDDTIVFDNTPTPPITIHMVALNLLKR